MRGEHVVHHHRVGGDEVRHRPVVREQVFEKPHRLLGQAVPHGRRELREVLHAAAVVGNEVADSQPPSAKLLGHAAGPAVLEHPPQLLLHHGGLVEPRRCRHERLIGDRIPEQKTQPRGQFHARHRLPARPVARLLDAVQKPRRREHAGQRRAESRIVLHVFGTVGLVAGEDRLTLLRGQRPTPGPGGEGDELLQMGGLSHRLGGTEGPLVAVHLVAHRLDVEKHHPRVRFVAIVVYQIREHTPMRDRVFAHEMQLGPQPLELGPASVVEQQPPQRLVNATEHEQTPLRVPRDDRLEQNSRREEPAKLRGRPGPLGGHARMHNLRHPRLRLFDHERVAALPRAGHGRPARVVHEQCLHGRRFRAALVEPHVGAEKSRQCECVEERLRQFLQVDDHL